MIDKQLNSEVRELVTSMGLSGDPAAGRNLPVVDDPVVQLGMKLFFSKALGGDMDVACVSCHHPVLGGGDNLSLPVGVDAEIEDLLGPGRFHSMAGEHFDGGPTVPRNAPSTFNIGLWDQVLFHDGRVESLGKTPGVNGDDNRGIRTPDVRFGEADPKAGDNLTVAQARFPVTSPEEMKDFGLMAGTTNAEVRAFLAQRIGGYGTPPGGALLPNEWLFEFQTAFNAVGGSAEELITFENITKAIAAYEQSQVFVETPWKAYVQGDSSAISNSAKRGALVFFRSVDEGGADCASCHSGDFFTDEQFHVVAMPQIGRGKGDGVYGDEDFGRFRETGDEQDRYAFRTPTLLNTTATGPWGHAGAYTTLENAVRHHLNPQAALDGYDWTQLDATIQAANMLEKTQLAINTLLQNRAEGLPSLQDVDLNNQQFDDLMAFLATLTDPCIADRACIGQWIPDAGDTNPDGLRVEAIDENSNPL
ncbi:cytochrome-c peroxidase [Microbulbifer sp. 2304DJ12-6]|uniref:cytochrome-c peroxidase n=1 Tax=Microbulbifer sp. 2304DJ12-6 TaxID=3233340 RepID=UPI0039B05BDF